MAVQPNFPESPYATLDPAIRWFPADEALCETTMDKLMPPLGPGEPELDALARVLPEE